MFTNQHNNSLPLYIFTLLGLNNCPVTKIIKNPPALKILTYSFRRSGSCTPPTTPVSHDMIELKESESNFASTIPFSCLEVIATLGVGGFGRVELVRNMFAIITLPLHDLKHANRSHFYEVSK